MICSNPSYVEDAVCAWARRCSDPSVMRQEALSTGGGSIAEGVHLTAALKDGGSAHSRADAHGHHAKAGSLAALVHFMQQCCCGTCTCSITMFVKSKIAQVQLDCETALYPHLQASFLQSIPRKLIKTLIGNLLAMHWCRDHNQATEHCTDAAAKFLMKTLTQPHQIKDFESRIDIQIDSPVHPRG